MQKILCCRFAVGIALQKKKTSNRMLVF